MAPLTPTYVVLLDYGGVLAHHHLPEAEATLARALASDSSRVRAQLSETSEIGAAFRRNLVTETDFWTTVSDNLTGHRSLAIPAMELTTLWCETYALVEGVPALLAEVRQRATVALVTNIDVARYRYLRDVIKVEALVDLQFLSFTYGVMKQAQRFWELIADDLSKRYGAYKALYLDDRLEHVERARGAGFASSTCSTDRAEIRRLIFDWLPPR